jgi:hypothetical protein
MQSLGPVVQSPRDNLLQTAFGQKATRLTKDQPYFGVFGDFPSFSGDLILAIDLTRFPLRALLASRPCSTQSHSDIEIVVEIWVRFAKNLS